jgi:hypothetical protein
MANRYLIFKRNQRRLKNLGKWNAMARKYLKFRSLQLSSKWFKMADRLLCINDEDHRRKGVESRWLKMMIRYRVKHPAGWTSFAKAALKIREKRGTKECWKILVEKAQRKHDFGNKLMNSIVWKARI